MFTRRNKSKCNTRKNIPKKKKFIKSLALSPLIKDPTPNQDTKLMGLNKYQCLTLFLPPFLSVNKILLNAEMMIILKLQILHNMKKMIRHILVKMILLQKLKVRNILIIKTNTKRILRNIKTLMNF